MHVDTFNMAILFLPILVLLIAGFLTLIVFAIVRKKWALLFIPLGLVAGLIFIVFIGKFFDIGHTPRHSGSSVVTAISKPAQKLESSKEIPLPSVWSPGIEKEFEADVYYSVESALRGIAGRLDKVFAQMALNGETLPSRVALLTYKDQFSKEDIDQAVSIFQKTFPDTEFIPFPAGTAIDAALESNMLADGKWTKGDAWLSLGLTETSVQDFKIPVLSGNYSGLRKASEFKSGKIKVTYKLKSRKTYYDLKYTEKPWLDNISAFQNSYPSRQWLIAYSKSSSADYSRANQALNRAISLVNDRLFQILGAPASHVTSAELYNYGIICDNFTQSFRGSSTTFFRDALLLDVSPDRLMPLAQQKTENYNMQRRNWAYQILSAIGIALVICIIYLILNAATKGYYTVVLRTLTILGIIGTVILLLALA